MARETQQSLSKDKTEHYSKIADDASSAFDNNNARLFYSSIKKLLPCSSHNFPFLLNSSGVATQTPLEARQAVQSHFSNLSRAVTVQAESLVSASQKSHDHKKWCPPLSPDEVDRLFNFLVTYFSKLNPNKAFGEDTIPPAIIRSAPEFFARLMLPAYVCAVRYHLEPIVWAGGNLHDFPKKAFSFAVKTRRGVLLEDIFAKALHSFVRVDTVPYLESYLFNSMYGVFLRGVLILGLSILGPCLTLLRIMGYLFV